ncbi:rhodanese-like domain-containing protein [Acetobacter senegalensis]|uniref:rhodanese-like domain-containing protein n=1 Tax=Acetobacter senegalensis TaxID=446692 RepID=UPI00209DE2C8|nr:rhodanese-like domain-containing protein [Acetobacter senegalensis]MCP1195897.1 rhodanese-like domain-containing protein [Acetobacter senegalensis]
MKQDTTMIEDVSPQYVWAELEKNDQAVLVDVRTMAEWQLVGVPDLASLGQRLVLVSWQDLDGTPNARFAEDLEQVGVRKDAPVYFICRSGVRSLSAAQVARQAGYRRVYNVADGFEGPLDIHGHRGSTAGWKASALPWRQN